MSLLAVLDIRFGDPITAIALNEKSLIHGSMMGRIVYYSFTHSKEYQINEISEELIRCINLSEDEKSFFVSVGDYHCINIKDDDPDIKTLYHLCSNSTFHLCNCDRSYTMQQQHLNIILFNMMPYEEEQGTDLEHFQQYGNLMISNFKSNINEMKYIQPIPYSAVPFDFDSGRILWLEHQPSGHRKLKIYDLIKPQKHEVCPPKPQEEGKDIEIVEENKFDPGTDPVTIIEFLPPDPIMSHIRMINNHIFIILQNQIVASYTVEDNKCTFSKELYKHKGLVIATTIFDPNPSKLLFGEEDEEKENNAEIFSGEKIEKELEIKIESHVPIADVNEGFKFVSLDHKGNIYIYDWKLQMTKIIEISKLKDLPKEFNVAELFAMGYPYYIKMHKNRISFSTDIGVCIIEL